VLILLAVALASATVWNFPWATDDPVHREDEIREFYELAYATESATESATRDVRFEQIARQMREFYGIRGSVQRFVAQYQLENARVLEVGSGDGYLQDVVDDYTGLDIAASAAQHYHKPFVAGTATAMPFRDAEFDALWTVWVLEHIPNPEAALSEMRRVVRPGGLLLLMPAWDVVPWAADGLSVRPFSDLNWWQKIEKLTVPARESRGAWLLRKLPVRAVRAVAGLRGPTRLHYQRLQPNFDEYWEPDSDAVSRIDAFEAAMWFESRGDACLNCPGGVQRIFAPDQPLVIRRGERP
jgi:SAM-dependent methyltransferase